MHKCINTRLYSLLGQMCFVSRFFFTKMQSSFLSFLGWHSYFLLVSPSAILQAPQTDFDIDLQCINKKWLQKINCVSYQTWQNPGPKQQHFRRRSQRRVARNHGQLDCAGHQPVGPALDFRGKEQSLGFIFHSDVFAPLRQLQGTYKLCSNSIQWQTYL